MSGELADEEWRSTRRQRDALRQKFAGRCAYCGCELGRSMHADHLEPCIRIIRDPWRRPLPAGERTMLKPERNTVGNMMPACAACNHHKGSYALEAWRDIIQRSAEIVAKQTSTFRAGQRFGVIAATDAPVVFYFERVGA